MKRPTFGSVAFRGFAQLSDGQEAQARELVAAPGRALASIERAKRFEFGLVDGVVALARPIGGDEIPEEDGDEDLDECDECHKAFADDDLSECGVCNELVCDKCRDGHEWECDRWQ